ncbi:hypothetical protein LCGC14_1603480 [marine sediment metagenome]|uniref:Uncharacterized protein n=1 Tax=marine sediment metagenome TaxID=412755 RepID=A0A0F9KR85_9ZZZZ
MASTIVLVPKRKVAGFIGAGSDALANMINHVGSTIPGSPPAGETVAYWHVTEELRIPVGTDKHR